MVQLLKRNKTEFRDFVRVSGLTDLQLSTTANDNYKQILDSRTKSLGDYDDLSNEEINDINEYRSNSENTKKFSTVDDFINDLND